MWLPKLLPIQVLLKICCHCILSCLYPKISSRWFTGSVGVSISMTNASSWTTMWWCRQYLSVICTEECVVLIHARESLFGRKANSWLWSHFYLIHYESLLSIVLEENLILESSVRVKFIASHCFLECFLLFVPSCYLLKCALKKHKQLLV